MGLATADLAVVAVLPAVALAAPTSTAAAAEVARHLHPVGLAVRRAVVVAGLLRQLEAAQPDNLESAMRRSPTNPGTSARRSWRSEAPVRSDDDAHLLIGRALGQTYRRNDKTESYVSVPPAFLITDSDGAAWTFGMTYNAHGEVNVLRNDVDTGEFAERIEYRDGVVRLFGRDGRRSFSRSRRHLI